MKMAFFGVGHWHAGMHAEAAKAAGERLRKLEGEFRVTKDELRNEPGALKIELENLLIDLAPEPASPAMATTTVLNSPPPTRAARILRANAEELAAHEALLAAINKESKGKCLWMQQSTPENPGA